MTLEEGIRILKNEKNETFSPYQVLEARDTLINYIENESIPKEKVREILKECQNFIDEFENNEKDSIKEYKKLVNDYDVGLKQGVKAEIEMWKKNKMEYVHKRNILMELLGE